MNDEGSLAINRSEATDRSPASWEGRAIRKNFESLAHGGVARPEHGASNSIPSRSRWQLIRRLTRERRGQCSFWIPREIGSADLPVRRSSFPATAIRGRQVTQEKNGRSPRRTKSEVSFPIFFESARISAPNSPNHDAIGAAGDPKTGRTGEDSITHQGVTDPNFPNSHMMNRSRGVQPTPACRERVLRRDKTFDYEISKSGPE